MTTRIFQRGETVPIWVEVKDWEGNYISPSNGVALTVTDYDGTVKVNGEAMTLSATGKYVYYYLSLVGDVVGWWRTRGKAQDGTGDNAKYTIVDGGFELH